MFTGLVETMGILKGMDRRGNGARLAIGHSLGEGAGAAGDSIAVNGVCLTMARAGTAEFICDVLQETLSKTALGGKPRGASLNLERAVKAGDRLGGHIVTGHVDGTGRVAEKRFTGDDWILRLRCASEILGWIVPRGSIACDGVSLTVAGVHADGFSVHIIPHTWEHTALQTLTVGARVNLEGDILAKYAQRAVGGQGQRTEGLTEHTLRLAGF